MHYIIFKNIRFQWLKETNWYSNVKWRSIYENNSFKYDLNFFDLIVYGIHYDIPMNTILNILTLCKTKHKQGWEEEEINSVFQMHSSISFIVFSTTSLAACLMHTNIRNKLIRAKYYDIKRVIKEKVSLKDIGSFWSIIWRFRKSYLWCIIIDAYWIDIKENWLTLSSVISNCYSSLNFLVCIFLLS